MVELVAADNAHNGSTIPTAAALLEGQGMWVMIDKSQEMRQ
jgi:hypothetical protein